MPARGVQYVGVCLRLREDHAPVYDSGTASLVEPLGINDARYCPSMLCLKTLVLCHVVRMFFRVNQFPAPETSH
jgi:hypothetical protein